MDLQVYAIIAIVFLTSLLSLLFINKTRGGKSFEDVLAEKRQLAHLVGGSKYQKKSKNAQKLNNNNNKKDKKERKQKERKEQEVEESQNDSDAGSDSHSASSNSPTHSKGGHVEFSEAEIINEESVSIVQSKKHLKKTQNRKNSATKPILINKAETPVVNTTAATETLNHFEQIHPKDDIEIKKQRDDAQSQKKKAQSKAKGSPKIEKVQAAAAPAPVVELVTVAEKFNHVSAEKESPKNAPAKDKLNKKKKNENILAQQFNSQALIARGEDVNVNAVMHLLGRADLARSEIQLIIDYLLNKQQDTLTDHSNWSDDPLQKLKKQLLEREQALAEEQESAAGLHVKLREMRTQINSLTAQNKTYELVHQKQQDERNTEIQLLTNDFKTIKDRLEQDNTRLDQAVKHLQEELYKKQQAVSVEGVQKLQQLTDANNTLTQEIQRLQQNMNQLQAESATKLRDLETQLQMAVQEEAKVSQSNANKDKEFSELYANLEKQLIQAKQLDDNSKVEIRNLQNALDSSDRETTVLAGEANKWRQLYNDLTKTTEQAKSQEVEQLIATVSEVKSQLAEKDAIIAQSQVQLTTQFDNIAQLKAQIVQFNDLNATATQQLSHSASEAQSRLSQETEKVTELTTKLAEKEAALSQYQTQTQQQDERLADLQSQISQYKEKNNQAKLIVDQQPLDRTKQVLERLFPDVSTSTSLPPDASYEQWLDHLAAHIEQVQRTASSSAKTTSETSQSSSHKSQATITNHISHTSNSTQSSDANGYDHLILENAKLQATVDQFKTIVTDTDKVFKWLETKVQDLEQQLAEAKDGAI